MSPVQRWNYSEDLNMPEIENCTVHRQGFLDWVTLCVKKWIFTSVNAEDAFCFACFGTSDAALIIFSEACLIISSL
ncbi:hypothetical protein J6590_106077, partial [Homalodisca vitripennis]